MIQTSLYFIGIILLTFSYSLVQKSLTKFNKSKFIYDNYNYLWAILVLEVALVYPYGLLRNGSFEFLTDHKVITEIFKIAVLASIFGYFSGYRTISKKYDFDFCLVFPIFEEILFRGVIFILLVNSGLLDEDTSVFLSALLFGIMHFQYFGLKKDSIRFVVFAFIGGYYFSNLVLMTHSLLPSIFLHMIFNTTAIASSRIRNKQAMNNK